MILPVILAGGIGSRLWPLSRKESPKQFLPLLSENSMLQDTLNRVKNLGQNMLPPLIIGNKMHDSILLSQVQNFSISISKIILEPSSKGTAPAVTFAANWAQENFREEITLLILPADHFIDDSIKFCETILKVKPISQQEQLVAFGVKPQYVETGYGYILCSDEISKDVYRIHSFKEKPCASEAIEYISSGACYWNSGIYMFQASTYLNELEKLQPSMFHSCNMVSRSSNESKNFVFFDDTLFQKIPENSIDCAVMERTDKSVVAELSMEWNDVGSWSSLWAIRKKHEADNDGNIIRGNVLSSEIKNTYLEAQDRLVVAMGVENITIVETKDAVLVTHHNKNQEIKDIIPKLKNIKYENLEKQSKIYKPWGWYEVLAKEDYFLVKKIFLTPNSSISLQMHLHRSEHWVVVRGSAYITLENKTFNLEENQHVYIPIGSKHRIENISSSILEIIEVQTGVYLDENDIVRFNDRYGREIYSSSSAEVSEFIE